MTTFHRFGKLYTLGIFLICGFLLTSVDDCESMYMAELEQRAAAQRAAANSGSQQKAPEPPEHPLKAVPPRLPRAGPPPAQAPRDRPLPEPRALPVHKMPAAAERPRGPVRQPARAKPPHPRALLRHPVPARVPRRRPVPGRAVPRRPAPEEAPKPDRPRPRREPPLRRKPRPPVP